MRRQGETRRSDEHRGKEFRQKGDKRGAKETMREGKARREDNEEKRLEASR